VTSALSADSRPHLARKTRLRADPLSGDTLLLYPEHGLVLNPSAAEWIQPKSAQGDTQEPWVFFVGRDGTINQRLDNVASDAELQAGVERLLA